MTHPARHEGDRIKSLDGLRAFAVLAIVFLHCFVRVPVPADAHLLQALQQALRFSYVGVDLFFVLSGFLIGGILLDQREATNLFQVFYLRRSLRIVPVYLLLLASYFAGRAVPALATMNFGTYFESPVPVWTYCVFVQNLGMAWKNDLGNYWLSPTWSLGIEEQFYLLMPLVIRRVNLRLLVPGCLAAVMLSPLLRMLSLAQADKVYAALFLLPMRLEGLMVGILCAVMLRTPGAWGALRRRRRTVAALVLAGASYCAVRYGGCGAVDPAMLGPGYTLVSLVFGGVVLVVLLYPDSPAVRFLASRPLAYLGRVSYFIYLAHQPVFYTCHWLLRNKAPTHLVPASLYVTLFSVAVTLALAALSWRYLEGPLTALGRRFPYATAPAPRLAPGALAPATE